MPIINLPHGKFIFLLHQREKREVPFSKARGNEKTHARLFSQTLAHGKKSQRTITTESKYKLTNILFYKIWKNNNEIQITKNKL